MSRTCISSSSSCSCNAAGGRADGDATTQDDEEGGYEQARGLRVPNQHARGHSAYVSKTMHIPVGRLYDAWNDPLARSRWLLDAPIEVRRSSDGKSMRITWTAGGSDVDVGFFAKGA